MGLKLNKTIDKENQKIVNYETKKWRNILHHLLDITLLLADLSTVTLKISHR